MRLSNEARLARKAVVLAAIDSNPEMGAVDIVELTGAPYWLVWHYMHFVSVSTRAARVERVCRVADSHPQWTVPEVARHAKVSVPTTRQILLGRPTAAGHYRPVDKWRKFRDENCPRLRLIGEAVAEGWTLARLGEKLGITREAARKAIIKYKEAMEAIRNEQKAERAAQKRKGQKVSSRVHAATRAV